MILGVDPGTSCGWALLDDAEKLIASGVWNLKPRRHEGGGMRFVHMRHSLNAIRESYNIEVAYYEEVRRHAGTDAAQIYGGLIATLTAWCESNNIPYSGVPVGTIKKTATGKGNADKDAMVKAARETWPEVDVIDDNEADARFVALAGMRAD